jgi:predicted SprT family Zn-dependent metalloprotease
VTQRKLSQLSSTTGGVRIIWSKTLRSTAGRANWRRTVTKNSGSPIKGNVVEGPGTRVEHFANIELAEKVIDCEERLVNTLAHEFCHLANFMVSGIKDQPHGASFKMWAKKVTTHLKSSENELWRKVEVTTKHDYKIDYKYLWMCMGRDRTRAMELLNVEQDEGCGAEYGRHSKSIDTEKSRCGRCKGRLVQVRPKPRGASPVKEKAAGKKEMQNLSEMVEVVRIED